MTLKFRKKPVVVEATYWNGTRDDAQRIVDWVLSEGGVVATLQQENAHVLEIYTLEGTMKVGIGDWVIKGVKGEFYPCKPDIFAETYEPIGEE